MQAILLDQHRQLLATISDLDEQQQQQQQQQREFEQMKMQLLAGQKQQEIAYERKLRHMQEQLQHRSRHLQDHFRKDARQEEAGKGAVYDADTDDWIEEVLLMKEISDEMLRAEHQLSCRLSRTLEEAATAEVAATDHDLQVHRSLVETVEALNAEVSALQNQERSEVQHLHSILGELLPAPCERVGGWLLARISVDSRAENQRGLHENQRGC